MNIAIASDHGGFELKEELKTFLKDTGISCTDLGVANGESVDYPDFGMALAVRVSDGEFERGHPDMRDWDRDVHSSQQVP